MKQNLPRSAQMDQQKQEWLTQMITRLYADSTPSDTFFSNIDSFLEDVANKVSTEIPGFGFDVYGSFTNGFITKDSDLDISIFGSEGIKGRFLTINYLKRISAALTRMGIQNRLIEARVPIIKCQRSEFPAIEMDISYDNRLAHFNTKLLNLYCQWEPKRLPQLGIFVKSLAKAFDINDASRKYPSSYAWILMLIHYLQNCEPAVLPCLQKNSKSKKLKKGYEVWKSGKLEFKVNTTIERNWSKNKQTTGELFIGFFNYLKQSVNQNKVLLVSQRGMGEPRWLKNFKSEKKLLVQDPFVYWEKGTIGSRDAPEVNHILKVIDLTTEMFNGPEYENAEDFLARCKFKIILEAMEGRTNSEVQKFYMKDQHDRFGGPSHEAPLPDHSKFPKPVFTQEDCDYINPEDYSKFWPEDRNELPEESEEAEVLEETDASEAPNEVAEGFVEAEVQQEQIQDRREVVPLFTKIAVEICPIHVIVFALLFLLAPFLNIYVILVSCSIMVGWILMFAILFPLNGRYIGHYDHWETSIADIPNIIMTPISLLIEKQASPANWGEIASRQHLRRESDFFTKFICPAMLRIGDELSLIDMAFLTLISSMDVVTESSLSTILVITLVFIFSRAFVLRPEAFPMEGDPSSPAYSLNGILNYLITPFFPKTRRSIRNRPVTRSEVMDKIFTRFEDQYEAASVVRERQIGRTL